MQCNDEWHQKRKLSPVAAEIMQRLRLGRGWIHSDYLEPTFTNAEVKRGADQLLKRGGLINVNMDSGRRGIWYIELQKGCR